VGQLGEQQVRREAPPQPGEAAQDREPRQAGDRTPALGPGGWGGGLDRGQEDHRGHEEDDEEDEGGREGKREGDKGRERGEETREHGCDGMKRKAEVLLLSPMEALRGHRSRVCVCVCLCVC